MRVVIAAMSHETNRFSPVPAPLPIRWTSIWNFDTAPWIARLLTFAARALCD